MAPLRSTVRSELRSDIRRADGSSLLEPGLGTLDALSCDAIVAGVCSDVRPLSGLLGYVDWRLCGRLSDLLARGVLRGDVGERVLVPTMGRVRPRRIFLYGWGPRASLEDDPFVRLQHVFKMVEDADVQDCAFALPEPAAALLPVVEDELRHRLGARLVGLFAPDPLPVA